MSKLLRFATLTILVFILFILSACGPKYIPAPKSEVELLDSAVALFDRLETRNARLKFEELKFEYPGSINIAQIQFYIGMCSFLLKDYIVAEQELRLIVRDFPLDEPCYASAYFYMMEAMLYQTNPAELDQEMTYQVLDEVERFLSIYPDHPKFSYLAKNMHFSLKEKLAKKTFVEGYIYSRLGHFAAAKKYFRMLSLEYPDSRWTVKGRCEWARCAMELKEFSLAEKQLDTCISDLTKIPSRYERFYSEPQEIDFIDRIIHIFGLIPFDNSSMMQAFMADLQDDARSLKKKIERKKAVKANEKS